MAFCIVEREETLVAGLPVRSPRRALGKLRDPHLERAWSAVLKRDADGPLASTYTDHAEEIGSYYTQTVGYCCRTLDEVHPGYVVSRLPSGTYAKFSAVGSHFPDVFSELWRQIWAAESRGEIVRAFTGDFECYPHAYCIELYISIKTSEYVVAQ
ncbi:GyrI-like domain-containing protein [Rhodococcus coprophilus]|uniref:AraC family transcriptional regulator n=1 Tax=Rhodococcus coprophilus TaxID=38310 RepID=A0A2X4TTX9_9NOCA|nr:GyrI-like domain-containing protein [Rhodococcus coprophilus]MBM7457828.1 putative transcriptional regulator YdeE [Rhodococcus coprophilus]SQI30451.1 AraC family transcriptional regulator [Rhodococcus coprophilus]